MNIFKLYFYNYFNHINEKCDIYLCLGVMEEYICFVV